MAKLFNNIGISVGVLCIFSLLFAPQKGTSFVLKHFPKKNLEVGIVHVSHKEKSINNHPLLGGLKAKTQGNYMSRYFEDDLDDDVIACLQYLKTTLIVCNSDNLENANRLCHNTCTDRKGFLSGTCENLETFPTFVGADKIVIDQEEQNNDEVQVVRPNGSFKGVKFASLDEYIEPDKGIENNEEFNNNQDQDSTFGGIIRATAVLQRQMGCFCCMVKSQR